MNLLVNGFNEVAQKAKQVVFRKEDAVDQIVIMFIIIAIAAGIAGILYKFGTGTLIPSIEDKITLLIDSWFDAT